MDTSGGPGTDNSTGTNPNRPIFIMGCQRSGTTLVSQLLANHPAMSMYHESFLYHIFFNELGYYGNLEKKLNLERLVEDVADVIQIQAREIGNSGKIFTPTSGEILQALEGNRFEDVITAILKLYAAGIGKRRGGDKTPENYRFLKQIQQGFPDCPIVYLMRDPRDTIHSSSDMFGTAIEKGADMWNEAFQQYARATKPVHLVQYEKLVADPEKVLREICDYIGEEFDQEMFSFYENLPEKWAQRKKKGRLGEPISKASIGNFQNLPKDDVKKIEVLCAEGMAAIGYKFSIPEEERKATVIQRTKKPGFLSQAFERLRYYGFNASRWRHGWPRWRLLLRNRFRYYSGLTLLQSLRS